MKGYKLVFAPAFAEDLHETFSYIRITLDNPEATKRLMQEIDSAIMRLKDFPEMCPLCGEPLSVLGYRKLIVRSYILIYAVDYGNRTVSMLRCFYGRQNYLRFFR